MRNKIIIVDKNASNRALLARILSTEYLVVEAVSADDATAAINQSEDEVAAVLIDMLTSQEDEFALMKIIRESNWHTKIPMLVVCDASEVTMGKKIFEYGASECISQPFDETLIRLKVSNIVKLFQYKNELEQTVQKQTERLQMQNRMMKIQSDFLKKSNLSIIELLGTMAEYRNLESSKHVQRVKLYTKILAEEVMKSFPDAGLNQDTVSVIASASVLHDIGKIAIPDSILFKPGKLTDEEYEYMKSHTICGCEILENIKDAWSNEYAKISIEVCRHHHERYDGNGYPDGLKGEEIPLSAQIVSVADAYDALVNERVYKSKIPKDRAFRMIINGECGIFSPMIMTCFSNCREAMENV